MSTLHPHNYYFSPTAQPTVCALSDEGMVYWLDNNVVKHQRNYRGQFIPLVEAPTQLPTGIPATVAPLQVVEATPRGEGA